MDLDQEMRKEIESNMKAIVVMTGEATLQTPFIMNGLELTPAEIQEIREIIANPNHPWMIEHKQQGENFEKKLAENHQKDMEYQNEARKQLRLKTKEKIWNRKNTFQKFAWYASCFLFWSLISISIIYFLVGITLEIYFDYTLNLNLFGRIQSLKNQIFN